MPEKAGNGDPKLDRILEGLRYSIEDSRLLREELRGYAREAQEDRKKFAAHCKRFDEHGRRFDEHIERLDRYFQEAAEDRRKYAADAAEDRKRYAADAAQDRREMKDLVGDIRKALVIIGKRGGDFVEIQKEQGAQLKKVTQILVEIRHSLRPGRNGSGRSNGS